MAHGNDRPADGYTGYIKYMAFWISLTAVHVYVFSYTCCFVARNKFIKGVINVFQFMRLLMVAGSLIPAVVHCQIFYMFPNVSNETFPPAVVGLMVFNIFFSFLARDLLIIGSCNFPKCEPPRCKPGCDTPCCNAKEPKQPKEPKQRSCSVCVKHPAHQRHSKSVSQARGRSRN